MKICIGAKIMTGPWGGGNLFYINLSKYLELNGVDVVYDLKDKDIDLILLTDPRLLSESSSLTDFDIRYYKKFINNNVQVVHRINECDERKNTSNLNKFLIKSNKVADATVFVSEWLKNLFIDQGIDTRNLHVIMSGSDEKIFNRVGFKEWKKHKKLKIVTHHWGNNWNKGFDIYKKLDELLENEYWFSKYEFTYIGNLPRNFKFQNTKHLLPISGHTLANELKKSNLYLTGSLNEPSGNHHIEAAQCGLPILYIDSGGIPEYCDGFGLKFTNKNFESRLEEFYENYSKFYNKMESYSFNSKKMCKQYFNLFQSLSKNNVQIRFKKYLLIKKIIFLFLVKIRFAYKTIRTKWV